MRRMHLKVGPANARWPSQFPFRGPRHRPGMSDLSRWWPLSDNVWRGRLELVRIGDDIRAFGLAGGSMLMALLAPVD